MSPSMLFITYCVIIIVICIIIINTNSPVKALAYTFLVLAFPVLGIIVYFTIGVNFRKHKLYSKKLAYNRKAFPKLIKNMQKYRKEVLENNKEKLGYYYTLADNENYLNFLTTNNKIDLIINGENKFPEVIKALQNAKNHIHFEYYIYEDDEIGKQISEILIEKAKEGVKVRFMYDDFGSKTLPNAFLKNLKNNGIEVFPFYKIKWILFANGINYRNHRKIIVIDGNIGFMGGINVSDRYINNGKNKLYWRDTHLRMEGLSVMRLQHIFLTDWNFCAKQNIEFNSEYFPVENEPKGEHYNKLTQVVASGPDSDQRSILYFMIQAIILSQKEVLITTPYFIPDFSFIDALKIAKLSGIKVKILVPGKSDSFIVNAVSRSYYEELLEVGIEIYQYQKGFVHAKTMICDEQVSMVGTANLDQRSFDLNFEVNSIIYDHSFAKSVKDSFENDIKSALKINLKEWQNRPWYQLLFERFARLLSPLM